MTARFELYRDRAGQFRWRLVHANGHVIADSGQGYASKQKARQGIRSVRRNAPGADVVELTPPPNPGRPAEPGQPPNAPPPTDDRPPQDSGQSPTTGPPPEGGPPPNAGPPNRRR